MDPPMCWDYRRNSKKLEVLEGKEKYILHLMLLLGQVICQDKAQHYFQPLEILDRTSPSHKQDHSETDGEEGTSRTPGQIYGPNTWVHTLWVCTVDR